MTMKILLLVMVVTVTGILCVSATRPPACAAVCDPDKCLPVRCRCGSQQDDCNCCNYCNTCPGDECINVFKDTCTEDHYCALENPSVPFQMGGKGHCIPRPGVEAGAHAQS
ncbi:8.6 kDa transglutaminase substrate-like [Haemaphysalis longicornis]